MISIVSVVVLASAFVCVSANEIRRDPNLLSGVVVNDADRKTVGEGPEPYPETPSHNLSNEISQSSYSRRRRLTPISCDSVDNGICSTSSTITLASEGIFGPSGLLFNGAVVESSVKSLVIQSTVECTGVLCKMTFQDFDLLQISGTGSILGSDILFDVNTLHILQGGIVSGTARGHPEGQGPSPGFFTCLSSSAFGGSHGGKSGYWYLPVNELYFYETYGSETFPADFGSGGTDSSGGGRISINATVKVEVDGTISEDGGGCIATELCGSAAGGSIYIASEEVLGTGRITADGGALALSTTDNAASGGGGRIAIYTNKESLGLTISASGGSLNSNPLPVHTQGESGTIFRDKFQGNANTSPVPYPADSPAESPTTVSPTTDSPTTVATVNPVTTDGIFGNMINTTVDAVTDYFDNNPNPLINEDGSTASSSGALATSGFGRTACLAFVTVLSSFVGGQL
ncbi:hypothetical protein ACHAW5_010548 [Stephanodiscus triporus]|uniref:Uncharacterized protein n=1 Tax=Stephanodiscus triporus TaxID=2934178 RepID=A0ABD3P7V2_9STRA